jgi:predicted SAM-dependent methyltransferase
MDLRCELPLADNTTRLIFTEHVLEHLDYDRDLAFVMSEFYRVLKPGGAVRIIVPDLEKYCRAYVIMIVIGSWQLKPSRRAHIL